MNGRTPEYEKSQRQPYHCLQLLEERYIYREDGSDEAVRRLGAGGGTWRFTAPGGGGTVVLGRKRGMRGRVGSSSKSAF